MTLASDVQVIKYIIEDCQNKATPVEIVMHLQAKELFRLCHKFASGQMDHLLVADGVTIVTYGFPGMPGRVKHMYFLDIHTIERKA